MEADFEYIPELRTERTVMPDWTKQFIHTGLRKNCSSRPRRNDNR